MYVPKQFRFTDSERVLEFIKTFNFGTIVSTVASRPVATHLPFVVAQAGKNIVLSSHFARANTQWQDIEGKEVLVIFAEPHAYISPRFYDKKESVPTWNYVSVHAYGKVKIIADQEEVFAVLESMIDTFEADYKHQWSELSPDYKINMAKGILAFEVHVSEIQAVEKLSQNKSDAERQRIKDALSASNIGTEQLVGKYMK